MIIKDLGAVSAYAYAVEKGYTGTEEEFATLMASYATVAAEAAESAESANQSAESASASAQTATTKASEASTSATQAGASATSASQSASTATQKASEASASASTASTKASEASTSATTASSKASEASQSASDAQTAQGLAESARDDAVDAKTDAETARDLAQRYAESINPENIFSAYPADTASGSVASFADGADDIPMKSVKVAIEPMQDLHGYDHPWPAGGGKNKLPLTVEGIKALNPSSRGTWNGNSYTYLGITYNLVTDSDGNVIRIHVSGTKTGASYLDLARISSIPYGTYIISGGASGIGVRAYHFDGTHIVTSTASTEALFTSTEDAGNNTFDVTIASNNEVNVDIYPMVRLTSDSDNTYAPYSNICPISGWTGAQVSHSGADRTNPTTYSITFPTEAGTIYGGELDVTNGVLTVDRAFIASYNGEALPSEWISDRDKYVAGTTPTTGAQVCYKLSQAVVYNLTPTEIKSLLGDNNVWADAGDTTVVYRADTAKYIDKKIAEVINALS